MVDNKFTIDELNIHKKVYDMLNRIAVSGGSYEDWQEAVFGEDALRRAESHDSQRVERVPRLYSRKSLARQTLKQN